MSDLKGISFHNRELIWFILLIDEKLKRSISMSHSIDEKLRGC